MRTTAGALFGSFLFFLVAPIVVAGWVPYRIFGWTLAPPLLGIGALRIVGAILVVIGSAIVIECFVRFAVKGRGTPAPVAPTELLVSSGFYRHVRNPIYVGLVTALVGEALLLGRPMLFAYTALVWLSVHLWVLGYEEPTLIQQFGGSYEAYRTNVGRWWPRLTPWNPQSTETPGGARG